jgi:chaperonin GroES
MEEKLNYSHLRPLGDRIVLERIAADTKTKGGLFIPDTAQTKTQEGKVLAVGDGAVGVDGKRTPVDIKVGDRVIFNLYAGAEIIIDGKEFLVLREPDILGTLVLKEESAKVESASPVQ